MGGRARFPFNVSTKWLMCWFSLAVIAVFHLSFIFQSSGAISESHSLEFELKPEQWNTAASKTMTTETPVNSRTAQTTAEQWNTAELVQIETVETAESPITLRTAEATEPTVGPATEGVPSDDTSSIPYNVVSANKTSPATTGTVVDVAFLTPTDVTARGLLLISRVSPDPKTTTDSFGKASFLARCNSTHSTRYHAMPLNSTHHIDGAIYVHHLNEWDYGDEDDPRSDDSRIIDKSRRHSRRSGIFHNYHILTHPRRADSVFLLYTMEPPNYLPWRASVGFDGDVSYRRSAAVPFADGNEGICANPVRSLPFEPQIRVSVGIWRNNCGSATRNYVMDILLNSSLDVRSYGLCRRNVDPAVIDRIEKFNGGRPARADSKDPNNSGRSMCESHRVMMVLQQSNCEDYVTNLCRAWECGAVPIILPIGGLPDYESLYGKFPHVDASQRGWLDKVRRIMTDDKFYESFTDRSITNAWAYEKRSADARQKARLSYHCGWHGLRNRLLPNANTPPAARTNATREIQRCHHCEEELSASSCDPDTRAATHNAAVGRDRLAFSCANTSMAEIGKPRSVHWPRVKGVRSEMAPEEYECDTLLA